MTGGGSVAIEDGIVTSEVNNRKVLDVDQTTSLSSSKDEEKTTLPEVNADASDDSGEDSSASSIEEGSKLTSKKTSIIRNADTSEDDDSSASKTSTKEDEKGSSSSDSNDSSATDNLQVEETVTAGLPPVIYRGRNPLPFPLPPHTGGSGCIFQVKGLEKKKQNRS